MLSEEFIGRYIEFSIIITQLNFALADNKKMKLFPITSFAFSRGFQTKQLETTSSICYQPRQNELSYSNTKFNIPFFDLVQKQPLCC